jgi:hypothetical protein
MSTNKDSLVYSRISQQKVPNPIVGYTRYPLSLKVLKRSIHKSVPSRGGGKRSEISSFTHDSRRRLKFVCMNGADKLISQFCLTYHENAPEDGKILKENLNSLLSRLRYKFKPLFYLWVLEFQTNRQVPHFHLFSNISVNAQNQRYLAKTWNRLTSETLSHLGFHLHSRNFINWKMGRGNYLAQKYLGKEEQKLIPEHFLSVGRFWGCSCGLAKSIETISIEKLLNEFEIQVNPLTGEYNTPEGHIDFIKKVLRKHHESTVKFHQKYTRPRKSNCICIGSLNPENIGKEYRWVVPRGNKVRKFKSQISRDYSALLPTSGPIFVQILEYLKKQYPKVPF